MKKFSLIYATEENAYEVEELGTFDTREEAKEAIKENLEEDCQLAADCQGEKLDSLVKKINDNGFDGEGVYGYREIYSISEGEAEKRKAIEELEQLRDEIVELFEEDEDEEDW